MESDRDVAILKNKLCPPYLSGVLRRLRLLRSFPIIRDSARRFGTYVYTQRKRLVMVEIASTTK